MPVYSALTIELTGIPIVFDQLSQRLQGVIDGLRGRGRLTDENIADTLRQIRMALLDADVALPVVKTFIEDIRAKVVGLEVERSLTPGQALVRLIHDELVTLMGAGARALNLKAQPPVVILLAGLQGAGKTTTAAKLALWLKERERRKVLLASTDVHRPAAILQLERLARELDVDFLATASDRKAVDIARDAVQTARRSLFDVLIVDTAGRLHVDAEMMQEVRDVSATVVPTETLFVVDSMAGQDAVNSAQAFGSALDLTGVILTKADGDARGGAALSVRQVTGRPILFVGTGEKVEAFEAFDPARIAGRILGMGDVLSLVEEVTRKVDRSQAEKLARKIKKGRDFDLDDLLEQLGQIQQLGGLGTLMEKMPAQLLGGMPAQAPDDREIRRQVAIIRSMTPGERRYPKTIDGSRKRRIAAGSGVQVAEVNRLLKSHTQMQKMMKSVAGKGGMQRLMRGMAGRRLPGGPFRPG
jgi:signal recognition particle subunit SRP54